jgi:hypothetical protein
MWARKEEVDPLWECSYEELPRDGADVRREPGFSILHGLRWEEMWELESRSRNATRAGCVRVRVCVYSYVRIDRVTIFEEGLDGGCYAPTEFYDSEGDVREAMGADLPQGWDIGGVSFNGGIPSWGCWSQKPWCGTSNWAPEVRAWRKASLKW